MDTLSKLKFANDVWTLLVPSMMIVGDIVTGLTASWVLRKFKSSVMRQGLGKKIGELMAIIVTGVICYGTNVPYFVEYGVAGYVMLMEAFSICENLKKLGVKIPLIDRLLDNISKEDADNKTKGGKAK